MSLENGRPLNCVPFKPLEDGREIGMGLEFWPPPWLRVPVRVTDDVPISRKGRERAVWELMRHRGIGEEEEERRERERGRKGVIRK